MISGCAAIVEYPDHLQRDREQIVDYGCAESSINRMELLAVIRALRWIKENRPWPDVSRIQVITDSKYVFDNAYRAAEWRSNGWRSRAGQPLENIDLWREFLTARSRVGMTVHLEWTPGKKSPELKEIDKAAKRAAERGGPDRDYGFSRGAIARSKVKGAAIAFPADGQIEVIRPYRKNVMRRAEGENKVRFDLYSEQTSSYVESCFAFASASVAFELHRQNHYRVRFNSDPKYPQILEIIEPVSLAPDQS